MRLEPYSLFDTHVMSQQVRVGVGDCWEWVQEMEDEGVVAHGEAGELRGMKPLGVAQGRWSAAEGLKRCVVCSCLEECRAGGVLQRCGGIGTLKWSHWSV